MVLDSYRKGFREKLWLCLYGCNHGFILAVIVISTNEPVFVTKNGYGELVVMSMETYEEQLRRLEFYQELAISEKQFDEGRIKEARAALSELREKYAL